MKNENITSTLQRVRDRIAAIKVWREDPQTDVLAILDEEIEVRERTSKRILDD